LYASIKYWHVFIIYCVVVIERYAEVISFIVLFLFRCLIVFIVNI